MVDDRERGTASIVSPPGPPQPLDAGAGKQAKDRQADRSASQGCSRQGRILAASLLLLAGSVFAGPAIPWVQAADVDIEQAPFRDAQSLAATDRALVTMQDAKTALEAQAWQQTEHRLNVATSHLDQAEQLLETSEGSMAADRGEAGAGERALAMARAVHEGLVAELAWRQAVQENRSRLAAAQNTSAEIASVHALDEAGGEAEETIRGYDRASEQAEGLLDVHPIVAHALGITSTDAQGYDDRAHDVASELDGLSVKIDRATVEIAYRAIPQGQRDAMEPAHRERLDRHAPERLRSLFASFDRDEDEALDLDEAVAFYDWVETNVTYRYDDEQADPADDPGAEIGDGRPGSDHQQTPLETFDERMGDCEDTAALQIAFYRYWGIPAYMALVNASNQQGYDHALAIVRAGGLGGASEDPDGSYHYYAFDEGNKHGIEPGSYVLVDNAYSSRFGAISGGIDEGSFHVHEVRTLEQRLVSSR